MTKRVGFTLAEVLITLGIIGVVAAMTIPTLISNTNGAQFKTAYKKALSTLNQAVIMNIAIILAGGVGSRVGAGIPKQFVEIFDKPVIIYTLEKFQNHKDINQILVVCVAPYIQKLKELTEQFHITKVKWIIPGGSTFQNSVIHGVNFLEDKVNNDDIVLIHYGASPFVSEEIISDSIRVCGEKGNCVSATPVFLLMGNNKLFCRSISYIRYRAIIYYSFKTIIV